MTIKYLPANTCTTMVRVLGMNELHPHMAVHNQDFYTNLKADMEIAGLNHPLVVTRLTIAEWKVMKESNPEMLDPPDGMDNEIVYQIRCGNNRYRVAEGMGYTLIDCYVVDMKEANRLCHEQRTTSKY